MTNVFAREPLFTLDCKLFAYQFIYRDQANGAFPLDLSALSLNNDAHSGLNIDDLLQVGTTIINLPVSAIPSFTEAFTDQDLIIEISDLDEESANDARMLLRELKSRGFKLVLKQEHLGLAGFENAADYVKCELTKSTPSEIGEIKDSLAEHVKVIVTQVHTQFQFSQCKHLNIDYVQGFFFLDYKEQRTKALPASKLAYMQLMMEIAKPELDTNSLQTIFERDPTLSFLLMKFINNPLVNKSFKITSIRHALNFLGQLMIRRFVAIISLAGLNSDKPYELLNLSLSRAKYCELVDADLADQTDAMSAFLVGLFSLLHIILDKPLKELLANLELDEKIEQALIGEKGTYNDILLTAKSMESGDWATLYRVSTELGIDNEHLFEKYRLAVSWQNDISQVVSPCFPVATPQNVG